MLLPGLQFFFMALSMQFKNQVVIIGCFFKPYSLLLQSSECVQSKNGVDLIEVSIFHKSEKTSGQTVRSIEIKTAVLS